MMRRVYCNRAGCPGVDEDDMASNEVGTHYHTFGSDGDSPSFVPGRNDVMVWVRVYPEPGVTWPMELDRALYVPLAEGQILAKHLSRLHGIQQVNLTTQPRTVEDCKGVWQDGIKV